MGHYDSCYEADAISQMEKEIAARDITDDPWAKDYVDLAEWWAQRKSKDPSTKVGAVIVRPNRTVVSIGYNGFPRGVSDSPERYADRETKLSMVVHAEANAIVAAGILPPDCTIYCSMFPCNNCAQLIIQAGIKHIVSPLPPKVSKWSKAHELSCMLFYEADVKKEFVLNE